MFTGRSISALRQTRQTLTVHGSKRFGVRQLSLACQRCAQQKHEAEDEPIPFSGSKAASWSMANSVYAPKRDIPWYQPIIVSFSLSIFLLYFFFLREENDLDKELNHSLFERVPQLEEHHLKGVIEHSHMMGRDTQKLEERYAEVLRNKAENQRNKAAEKDSS